MTDPATPASHSTAASEPSPAPIGVIGGSGFYSFLDDATEVAVPTPFGEPSSPVTLGAVGGRQVAFVPRHGRDHRFAPHRVNYRANLWALRALGVRQVLAPCAVGSLRAENGPGTIVLPDQVVDRTWGREHTVYDAEGPVVHVSMADPYCPRGRRAVLDVANDTGEHVVDGGTLVVINGPRFSSRAESHWHSAAGWSVVGMTGMPEAAIARELAICLTSIALVTDLDAGVAEGEGVTHHEVLEVFARNVERLKAMLGHVVPTMPTDDDCGCRHALDGQRLPFDLP
ncbi:S-methyl-5'-thioadenosine phosphorylase [Angustibacter sp. McL0619]|uniref:S-methyl-5'-thioadenosine phosphorylase n=1 Tax=Angustibacter sp. McL0619 TaxID=3415676 RepID=UPI003CE98C5B